MEHGVNVIANQYFRQFLPICGDKNGVFHKSQRYDQFGNKKAVFWVETPIFKFIFTAKIFPKL
jgi:hypothetical protein